MRPKEIQKLIKLVETSNIGELEVSRWGRKVSIRKYSGNNHSASGGQENVILTQSPAPIPVQAPVPVPVSEETSAKTASNTSKKLPEICSPMVGTYYKAPAPDAEPFVKIGDTVSQGQVLCIIEAMKLMNEIEAEYPCRILEILIENGQPVEYNQALFRIEKL